MNHQPEVPDRELLTKETDMKMKELRELLAGYSDDAEVVAVRIKPSPCYNEYYTIGGVNVQDWGKRFEIVITEEVFEEV